VIGQSHRPGDAESRLLDAIQREAFSYVLHETNPIQQRYYLPAIAWSAFPPFAPPGLHSFSLIAFATTSISGVSVGMILPIVCAGIPVASAVLRRGRRRARLTTLRQGRYPESGQSSGFFIRRR
jgi:hypothetical protein